MTPIVGASFTILLLAGMPVAFAMLTAGIGGVMLGSSYPATISIQRIIQPTQSFPLLAIPFFIIAGNLMMSGVLGERLIAFARLLVGRFQGGIGQVSVMGSLVFSGVSGSAVADASATGSALIPWQKREGYPGGFAAAVNASSSTLSILLPPSIPFILYAISSETSIGALFIAGIIPGLLLAAGQLAVCYASGRIRGFPVLRREEGASWFRLFLSALPAILMPVFIISMLRFGIATPTEVSVMAVAYALLVSLFIYRDLTIGRLVDCLTSSLVLTGTVLLIIMAASLWQWILSVEQIPQMIAQWAIEHVEQRWLMILSMIVVLLIVGTVLDLPPAILLLTPIFVAIAREIDLNLIQLGVIVVMGLSIGLYTPPVGTTLFISSAIARVPIGRICVELIPFYLIALLILLAAGFLPWISLGLQ